MLLLVAVQERSTARKICPDSPPGLMAPPYRTLPPRLTVVTWSNVGVTPPFWALLERMHQNELPALPAPMKRLPFVSTSNVPHCGEFGTLIGVIHVTPPSVERLKLPLPAQLN